MGNIRYRNEFYSIEGTLYKIDIIDTFYNGSPLEFITTDPCFELGYIGGKDRFDPIISSELKVSAFVQDAAFETFIFDIAGSGENRFFVKLYRDDVFFWAGVLVTDNIKMEDIAFPYVFEMSFTDGLGTLKDRLFMNELSRPFILYSGKESLIGFIYKIITHAGPGLNGNTLIWAETDSFIKTCVHWYDAHHHFYFNQDPLKYTRVSHEAYHIENNGTYTAGNCYDILYDILSAFGARIILSEGSYKIIQVNEHICYNQVWRNYRVTDGSYLSYSYDHNQITSADFDILTGRVFSFMPGLLKASKKYKYATGPGGINLLPVKNSYETVTALLGGIVGGKGEMLKFNGVVTQTLTAAAAQILANPIRPVFHLTLKITKVDGTINYLNRSQIPGTQGWTYSWQTAACYVEFFGNYVFKIQTSESLVFYVEFLSPPVPLDCNGTFQFTYEGFECNGSPINIDDLNYVYVCDRFTLQNLFPAEILTSGTLKNGFTYRINNIVLLDNFTNVGASSNATGVEFIATGETPATWIYGSELLNLSNPNASGVAEYIAESNSPGRSKVYKAKDTLIGDGYSGLSIGALETSDGSTWLVSSEWVLKNKTTAKRLHQLYANEVLSGQLTPTEIMSASFISQILRADKSIVLNDGTLWAVLNCTLNGKSDTWSGDWFKLKNMTVTEEAYVEHLWSLQSWVNEDYEEILINTPEKNSSIGGSIEYSSVSSLKDITSIQTITENSAIVIPGGYFIVLIGLKNLGTQVALKIGTTNGGTEIFSNTLFASALMTLPLFLLLSTTADQTIYITSVDWTGVEISFYIKTEKAF